MCLSELSFYGYFFLVRAKGFEPLHLAALDPKSSVSAVPPRPHIGAPGGTRTLMVSHWYLKPACLPIPPQEHI